MPGSRARIAVSIDKSSQSFTIQPKIIDLFRRKILICTLLVHNGVSDSRARRESDTFSYYMLYIKSAFNQIVE